MMCSRMSNKKECEDINDMKGHDDGCILFLRHISIAIQHNKTQHNTPYISQHKHKRAHSTTENTFQKDTTQQHSNRVKQPTPTHLIRRDRHDLGRGVEGHGSDLGGQVQHRALLLEAPRVRAPSVPGEVVVQRNGSGLGTHGYPALGGSHSPTGEAGCAGAVVVLEPAQTRDRQSDKG
jgi:hypothetical protein